MKLPMFSLGTVTCPDVEPMHGSCDNYRGEGKCELLDHSVCIEYEKNMHSDRGDKGNAGLLGKGRIVQFMTLPPTKEELAERARDAAQAKAEDPGSLFGGAALAPKAKRSAAMAPKAKHGEPVGYVPLSKGASLVVGGDSARPLFSRESIASLEALVEEVAFSTEVGELWLVREAGKGGARRELTFRDAAALLLVLESFPGARVIGWKDAEKGAARTIAGGEGGPVDRGFSRAHGGGAVDPFPFASIPGDASDEPPSMKDVFAAAARGMQRETSDAGLGPTGPGEGSEELAPSQEKAEWE